MDWSSSESGEDQSMIIAASVLNRDGLNWFCWFVKSGNRIDVVSFCYLHGGFPFVLECKQAKTTASAWNNGWYTPYEKLLE